MLRRILLPLLLVALLAPTVAAQDVPPSCASITRAGLTPYGPYLVPVFGPGTVYELWAEDNLLEGLQQVECLGADAQLVQPDRFVTRGGVDTGGMPICVPRLGCIF